ncbi:MAG: RecQ family zinc-binding domain-containing protein, partial [Bacteroidota bacterium]
YNCIKKLEAEGFILMNESFYRRSAIMILFDKSELYKFQVANPKLDVVIKNLLRLYGGELFSDFVPIREKEIASLLKVSVGQIRKWLDHLHDNEVIDYQNSNGLAAIIFLGARHAAELLPLDESRIEWRRKLAFEKANHMIAYLDTNNCRTNIFQSYFDEKPEVICGICDVDLTSKNQKSGLLDHSVLLSKLDQPKNIETLKATFGHHTEEQIMLTLRLLIEEKKVTEENGLFRVY